MPSPIPSPWLTPWLTPLAPPRWRLPRGRVLLILHHADAWARQPGRGRGRVRRLAWRLIHGLIALARWLWRPVARSEIRGDCCIAPDVCLPDAGEVVLAAESIGAGTVIGPRVTLGRDVRTGGRPRIGRNVLIAADCVVHGGIVVGDGATLLGGTVLGHSVPAGALVEGNPARVVTLGFDNQGLRNARR